MPIKPKEGGDTSSTKKPRNLINPCFTCKVSHLKCDAQVATCSRCRKTGIECVRGYSVRFRHTLNPSVRPKAAAGEAKRELRFSRNQPWVQIAKSFNFVDETQEVVNIHEASDQDGSDAENRPANKGAQTSRSLETASHRPTKAPLHGLGAVTTGSEDVEPPKKKRAQSLCSSVGGSTVSTTTEVADLLAQSSMASQSSGCLETASPSPPVDPDNLGLQLLLGAGNYLLDSGSSHAYPTFDYSILQPQTTSISGHDDNRLLSEIYLDEPIWPLRDVQEAHLFHYFVRDISPLFDMCDDERHFAKVVPQRAPTCPPLLNAMLASAAKRLNRKGQIEHHMVDKYYQECLRTLIPALSCPAAVIDENLLAAIVILRLMEEVDVPFSDTGPESHLIGTRVFLAAQESTCDFSGLRLAAFWVALRQEIFMAMIHSRPVHPNLLIKDIATLLEVSHCDCSYANRVIVHCAACIQYCFGQQEQSTAAWTELSEYLDRWFAERPWTFHPMSPGTGETTFFPEEMFLSDAVVTGMQQYYLARLILEAHNPNIPKLGPARKKVLASVNEEVKIIVRVVCGIAESNSRTAPAYVNASVAIAMAGDRFIERQEQEQLYNILVKTDQQMAWPTDEAQADMREAWGWPKSPEAHPSMSIAGILNSGMRAAADSLIHS